MVPFPVPRHVVLQSEYMIFFYLPVFSALGIVQFASVS